MHRSGEFHVGLDNLSQGEPPPDGGKYWDKRRAGSLVASGVYGACNIP